MDALPKNIRKAFQRGAYTSGKCRRAYEYFTDLACGPRMRMSLTNFRSAYEKRYRKDDIDWEIYKCYNISIELVTKMQEAVNALIKDHQRLRKTDMISKKEVNDVKKLLYRGLHALGLITYDKNRDEIVHKPKGYALQICLGLEHGNLSCQI